MKFYFNYLKNVRCDIDARMRTNQHSTFMLINFVIKKR